MLNRPDDKIQQCLDQLAYFSERQFRPADHRVAAIVSHSARFSLETIARSNAPYHDVEHTVLVTRAGQAILEGLHLAEKTLTQKEWAHFTIALLLHDIGYTKGICRADHGHRIATGKGDEFIEISGNCTDAALSRYHVDRSLMFVKERFRPEFDTQGLLNVEVIMGYIEMTRFPFAPGEQASAGPLAEQVRAADLVGQLGDPNRRQKCSALFQEFEEIGLNVQLGYHRPEDIWSATATFYRKMVAPHIQKALTYLRLTREGREWIANLQANVGRLEIYIDG